MADSDSRFKSKAKALPIAPSLGPALEATHVRRPATALDRRVIAICGLAILVAAVSAIVAQALIRLIGLITNLAFHGRVSFTLSSPAGNHLGVWVVLVPVAGALIVGLMARYGSKAIRGHGIPEAMEQILKNESRIPPRLTFLKPLSAAISIGTGGPFGAEGPIIATGGALGSFLGQLLATTAIERKTLLAAGAAAGMAATFGTPVAAVLLAVELLLFEYRPRSLVPVSLAAAVATAIRIAFSGAAPIFAMPELVQPSGSALAGYVGIGAIMGLVSVGVTRAVYAVEDRFEKLPIHWMWWPAIGAVAVGVVGYFAPRTMGVGYDNIDDILTGQLVGRALVVLTVLKLVSWVVSLGSGTSGGTLAPLFTIGGGVGALLGQLVSFVAPGVGVDVRLAALVGMAATFAGASRALLASVVFAFETTRQPIGLLPLLGGCTAAFLVSCLLMENTIMTEKIARRGVRVLADYSVDFLDQVRVRDLALRPVVTLPGAQTVNATRIWLSEGGEGTDHNGYPVVASGGQLIGVVTRRDLTACTDGETALAELVERAVRVIYEDSTLRDAADLMARERIGRLPVVTREAPSCVVGIVTRSDLVNAHGQRLRQGDRDRGFLRSSRP